MFSSGTWKWTIVVIGAMTLSFTENLAAIFFALTVTQI